MKYTIHQQPSKSVEYLARPDGMMIAAVINETVKVGEDPSKTENRVFITHEHAKAYLRKRVATEDAAKFGAAQTFTIEECDMENRIMLPEARISLQ